MFLCSLSTNQSYPFFPSLLHGPFLLLLPFPSLLHSPFSLIPPLRCPLSPFSSLYVPLPLPFSLLYPPCFMHSSFVPSSPSVPSPSSLPPFTLPPPPSSFPASLPHLLPFPSSFSPLNQVFSVFTHLSIAYRCR